MTDVIGAHVDERVRTTQARHRIASQTIWTRMREAGDIYLDKYAGWYSVRDEAYFAEEELTVDPGGRQARTRRRARRMGRGGELLSSSSRPMPSGC